MMIDPSLPLETNRGHKLTLVSHDDTQIVAHPDTHPDLRWAFERQTGRFSQHRDEDNAMRIRNVATNRPVTHFHVSFGKSDWTRDEWCLHPLHKFDDPKEAAAETARLNAEAKEFASDWRFAVKRTTTQVADYDAVWQSWMKARFEHGEYKPLPWHDTLNIPEHFAHVSLGDPCQVAYVSPGDGPNDHITVTTPGRYLARYFPDLDSAEISRWATKLDVECELKFALTPDEIEHVYTNGPNSCMSHSADAFNSSCHPTRIYGAGDLAIAYLERNSRIIARALCWPEKKFYGRMYGDTNRLGDRLNGEGYTSTGTFNGARMLKIEESGTYIMPYLDHDYCFNVHEDHLSLNYHGAYLANRTDGYAEEVDEDCWVCPHCGDEEDETESMYVDSAQEYWCRHCVEYSATLCDECHSRTDDGGRDACLPVYEGDAHSSVCGTCRADLNLEEDDQGRLVRSPELEEEAA